MKYIAISGVCALLLFFAGQAFADIQENTPLSEASSSVIIQQASPQDTPPKALPFKVDLPENPSQSERFIATLAEDALTIIQDEALDKTQIKSQLRELLTERFALRSLGRFSLGRYWRSLPPENREEYFDLFEDYISLVYASRFESYSGEGFEILGLVPSKDDKQKDFIVNSVVVPVGSPEINVKWRVRTQNGVTKVIDVLVEDVSMSVSTRSEFSSVIQRRGGNTATIMKYLAQTIDAQSTELASE